MRVCGLCKNEGTVKGLHNWKTGGKREQACWQCYEDNDSAAAKELRALRLWHWKQAVNFGRALPHAQNEEQAKQWREAQTIHMRAVQTLNSVFPIGDYAAEDE